MSFTVVPFNITSTPLPITTDGRVLFRDSSGTFWTMLLSGGSTTSQPLNANLTSISGLTTTSYGLGFLEISSPSAARSYLGVPSTVGSVSLFQFDNYLGVTGSVSNATTTPILRVTLTNIQPSSVTTPLVTATNSYGSTSIGYKNGATSYLVDSTGLNSPVGVTTPYVGTFTTLTTTEGRKRHVETVTAAYTMDTGVLDEVIIGSKATPFQIDLITAAAGINREIVIKNQGVGTITVAAAAAALEIFTNAAVATITLLTGESATLISDGTYYNVV